MILQILFQRFLTDIECLNLKDAISNPWPGIFISLIKIITNLVMNLQENYLIIGSSYFLPRISY